MPPAQSPETPSDMASLTRLPVFDKNRRLWGYELFCFSGGNASSDASTSECVGLKVANSAYMGLQHILNRGKKIMIHHGEKGILDNLPYVLPPASAIVKVDEGMAFNPDALDSLKRLKADRFSIAIDGYSADPACAGIYPLADIICSNVHGKGKGELTELTAAIRPFEVDVLAADVRTHDQFNLCREAGFSYFSGSFFKTPDVVQLRKISSNEVARFNLLGLLEAGDPDFEKLAENIQSDVSISFRLLAYLNSAAFGFRQKITSMQQAVAILGWDKMKNWLRVVLLTDVNQRLNTEVLTLLSAQRGKFIELVAEDHDFWGFDPDSLQLLGLFSLLDVMLGVSMEEVVEHLPLDAKLKAALCGEPDNEYLQLLDLARFFEEAKWTEADRMIQQLGLDGQKVKTAFQKAADWATELTHMVAPE